MPWDVCPAATRINQPYGCVDYDQEWKDLSCPGGYLHAGIDLGGDDIFQRPVYSTRAGVVVAVGIAYLGPYAVCVHAVPGDNVYIEHGHLDSALVSVGQRVGVGTPLGLVGTRGNSSGPHLHVEVRTDGPTQGAPSRALLDPTPYLNYPPSGGDEVKTVSEKNAFIRQCFQTYLGRHVSNDDDNFWTPKLADDGSNWDTIAADIQDSDEGKRWSAKLDAIRNS